MALYYSSEKRLTLGNAKDATLLFPSYFWPTNDKKSYETIEKESFVPNSSVSIKLFSTFRHGKLFGLYSIMYYGDKIVPNLNEINFHKPFDKISIDVQSESWDELYLKIIKQYNNLQTGEKDIDSYFDALDKLIEGEDLPNSDTMFESKRKGQLLLALRKLAEIANQIDNTIFFSSKILSQRLTNSSNLLVRTILNNSNLAKKTYDNEWEKHLTSVLHYLRRERTVLDILIELVKE